MSNILCPRCGKTQHLVCGNPDCVCHKHIPEGELPQIWTENGECCACPYCGLVKSADYWESCDIALNLHSEDEMAVSMEYLIAENKILRIKIRELEKTIDELEDGH